MTLTRHLSQQCGAVELKYAICCPVAFLYLVISVRNQVCCGSCLNCSLHFISSDIVPSNVHVHTYIDLYEFCSMKEFFVQKFHDSVDL